MGLQSRTQLSHLANKGEPLASVLWWRRPAGTQTSPGSGGGGRGGVEFLLGASLDYQTSLRWQTPQPGEELPSLFWNLRTKPPGGHLIPTHSGQASDPDTGQIQRTPPSLKSGCWGREARLAKGTRQGPSCSLTFPRSTGNSVLPRPLCGLAWLATPGSLYFGIGLDHQRWFEGLLNQICLFFHRSHLNLQCNFPDSPLRASFTVTPPYR